MIQRRWKPHFQRPSPSPDQRWSRQWWIRTNRPPLPGHVTMEQAWQFAKSLVRGEKHGGEIIKTVLENTVREVI